MTTERLRALQAAGLLPLSEMPPSDAEVEANTMASFSDAIIATLVVDPSVGPPRHDARQRGFAAACATRASAITTATRDGGGDHDDDDDDGGGDSGDEDLEAYSAVLAGVLDRLRVDQQLAVQRVAEVPRAVMLKGHRVEFDNLALGDEAEALRVRRVGCLQMPRAGRQQQADQPEDNSATAADAPSARVVSVADACLLRSCLPASLPALLGMPPAHGVLFNVYFIVNYRS